MTYGTLSSSACLEETHLGKGLDGLIDCPFGSTVELAYSSAYAEVCVFGATKECNPVNYHYRNRG